MDELKPIVQELVVQPLAFLGGLVSGLLRLDVTEDPLKTWLNKQGVSTGSTDSSSDRNGNGKGPQSISIE